MDDKFKASLVKEILSQPEAEPTIEHMVEMSDQVQKLIPADLMKKWLEMPDRKAAWLETYTYLLDMFGVSGDMRERFLAEATRRINDAKL